MFEALRQPFSTLKASDAMNVIQEIQSSYWAIQDALQIDDMRWSLADRTEPREISADTVSRRTGN